MENLLIRQHLRALPQPCSPRDQGALPSTSTGPSSGLPGVGGTRNPWKRWFLPGMGSTGKAGWAPAKLESASQGLDVTWKREGHVKRGLFRLPAGTGMHWDALGCPGMHWDGRSAIPGAVKTMDSDSNLPPLPVKHVKENPAVPFPASPRPFLSGLFSVSFSRSLKERFKSQQNPFLFHLPGGVFFP